MNQRINKCIEDYLHKFKRDIKDSITKDTTIESLLREIYDYPRFIISPHHYQKPKRVKNPVPLYERCQAKRADKEQCTRRRRSTHQFCGTHIKGTPHGTLNINVPANPIQKLDVWVQEINGINYYIDNSENVYNPVDVYQNKVDPRRIHTYTVDLEGKYILHN